MSDAQANTVDNATETVANIPASGQNPAQPDTTADSGTAPPDTGAEGSEPKKSGDGGFQRRINRLTREKHEALGRLDALQREVEELRTSRAATPTNNASDQEPRQDQFQRWEDYVAARAEWRAEQRVRAAVEQFSKQAQNLTAEQSYAQRLQAFEAKMASQGKGIEDFDEVMEGIKSDDLSISKDMAEYLMDDSDNTALLAKWLTDNPDEAARISRLRPTAQVKELRDIDVKLTSRPARTTRAPAPVSTVGGSSSPSGGMPKPTDINAWMEWRKKQA